MTFQSILFPNPDEAADEEEGEEQDSGGDSGGHGASVGVVERKRKEVEVFVLIAQGTARSPALFSSSLVSSPLPAPAPAVGSTRHTGGK